MLNYLRSVELKSLFILLYKYVHDKVCCHFHTSPGLMVCHINGGRGIGPPFWENGILGDFQEISKNPSGYVTKFEVA